MILYYITGHECTSYAPCVAPTPRHTHTHTVLFRAIPSIKLCAHFFFIIFIWNEYECQFSCCLLLLLLLFCCWFFPFKNFCFLVINYISAVAAASAAATRPHSDWLAPAYYTFSYKIIYHLSAASVRTPLLAIFGDIFFSWHAAYSTAHKRKKRRKNSKRFSQIN